MTGSLCTPCDDDLENGIIPSCRLMHVEHRLRATLAALFSVPGLVRPGAVLDAGANNGQDTTFLARLLPARQIVSCEPLFGHVLGIRKMANTLTNIEVFHGGLGDTSSFGSYPSKLDHTRGAQYNPAQIPKHAGDQTQLSR